MAPDLDQLVNALPGLVWIASADGRAEFLNQRWVEYTGLSRDRAIGLGWHDAIHANDLAMVLEHWRAFLESGQPGELKARLRRHDGQYRRFLFSASPMTDESGRIVRWCGINTDIENHVRSDDATRKRQWALEQIVEGLPAIVALFTANGKIMYCNRRMLDYLDETLEQVQKKASAYNFHPDDRDEVLAAWAASVKAGKPFDREARLCGADGVYRWHRTLAFPLHNAVGEIELWYGHSTDIDDTKRAEAALRSSERNLQLSIDTTPAMIWSSGPDGTTESVNQHFLDYVGFAWEELRDRTWSIAIHPDDYGALLAAWNDLRATGTAGHAEARLRRHDGEYRWFLLHTNPLRDSDGKIVKWYGVNIDIEDLKRAEAELSHREALLHQGEAVSETGSFLWRVETNELQWSDQLCRIFGFEPGTPMTLDRIATRVHPEDMRLLQDMVERARTGRDFEYQHRILMHDGSVKHLHLVAHATRDAHGRLEFIGASQDVTDHRLSEQALSKVRSELAHVARVTSLGALTASIAHEVNQPLAGIITNASTCLRMLAADPPNVEGALETARRTIRDGNRASDVIARLRALFTKERVPSEALDLNEAAREVLALSMSELQRNDIVVHQKFGEPLPPAAGDRVQIQQVILNLILNASDAMSEIRDRPRRLLVTTAREGTNEARLSVSDSGIGIDPQNFEALFQSFYTTKSHGMGMGLSISRAIIESHKGRLWADANDGPGATFSFSIPCVSEPTGADERTPFKDTATS